MQVHAKTVHAAYQTGQIGSADPVRIIVLLYEGAIRFARQAQERFGDPASRGLALGRAHMIVSELMASLDHGKGSDLSRNLEALYQYLLDNITTANVDGDRKALQSGIDVLNTLVSAWREIGSNRPAESR